MQNSHKSNKINEVQSSLTVKKKLEAKEQNHQKHKKEVISKRIKF